MVNKNQLKIVIFTSVKNRCILHGRVFVMDILSFLLALVPVQPGLCRTWPRGYKTFFQSQLKVRLKRLSLSSSESEFEFKVIKLSECDLS